MAAPPPPPPVPGSSTSGWNDLDPIHRPYDNTRNESHSVENPFARQPQQALPPQSSSLDVSTSTTTTTTTAQTRVSSSFTTTIRRKAKSHRKRHVPVGPAGVWFQASQQNHNQHSQKKPPPPGGGDSSSLASSSNPHLPSHANASSHSNCSQDDEQEPLLLADGTLAPPRRRSDPDQGNSNQGARGAGGGGGLSLCSSAWMCMQCDLNLVLPTLPPTLSETERCSMLRQCLPSNYRLLPDLTSHTNTEWKLAHNCKLLVMVQTIQSLTDNLWTVNVTDETLVTMTAWIQPKLVRQEQQRPQPMYIRPGLVWQLVNPTLILVHNNNHSYPSNHHSHNNKLERMLLISEGTIERAWTPAQAKDISDEAFVSWLERRNLITSNVMETFVERNSTLTSSLPPPSTLLSSSREIGNVAPTSSQHSRLEDRAPVGSKYDSDDEEFVFQESSQAEAAVMTITPRLPSQNPVQIHGMDHSAALTRQSPHLDSTIAIANSVHHLQSRQHVSPAMNIAAAAAAPAMSQHSPLDLHANHISPSLGTLSNSSHGPLPTFHNNDTRQLETTFGLTQLLSHGAEHIDQPNPPDNCGVHKSSLPLVSRSSLSPVLHPMSTLSPVPPRTAPLMEGDGGTKSSRDNTFGFSQFLSPSTQSPRISAAPQRETSQPQPGNCNQVSSDAVEADQCTPQPPPSAGSHKSPPTTQTSKSSTKRKRKRRKSTNPPCATENQPIPSGGTTAKIQSALWDASTCSLEILEMFDNDDSDEENIGNVVARDCTHKASLPVDEETAAAAARDDTSTGSDKDYQHTAPRHHDGPSLFHASSFNTAGLEDLFSDDDD